MKKLSISSLSKSYGANHILSNVSVEYASGLVHGLVGNNGAGKTTLLNCVAGYESYGGSIARIGITSIGYLHAEPYMFPRITGYEFVYFCLSAKKIKIDKQKIDRLNELFELPLGRYAAQYSTGMLKKLHLMSLILQNNDLLLLDEPFNGLDISSCACIAEILKRMKQKDVIIILSSHALHHLSDFCDTISYINNTAINFLSNKDDFGALIKTFEQQTKKKIDSYFY
jgi:ABC-2 type transport system ATP-binding protein